MLAAFVAGVIATSGISAIAEKTGNTEPVKTAAAATEQTTMLSPEDLCLPEEYITFLNQNKPPLVQILNYGADTEIIKRALDSINVYIQNFPIKDK